MSDNKNNNKGPGPTQYQKTTAGAVGGMSDQDVGSALEVTGPAGIEAMFRKPSDIEVQAMLSEPGMEFAPQVRSMEPGDLVVGILEGFGNGTEFTQDGVTRHVNTWILKDPKSGFRVSILSSYRLDGDLPPFIGALVKILRGKDIKTSKGFRVANYMVSGPKRPDGQERSWARKSPPRSWTSPAGRP